jgi:acyl-CoA thioesterase-1
MRFVLLFMACVSVVAQAQRPVIERPKPPNPYEQVTDVPGLPRVLLIGDSISEGYTVPVRRLLQGKANVHRIPQNGGPAKTAGRKIDEWLGQEKWDVIHFNWGLHDVMVFPGPKADRVQFDKEQLALYEQNLRQLVARLKRTGARLIWASSTPVPEQPFSPRLPWHRNAVVDQYNEAAARVMKENDIPIDDLHALAAPVLAEMQNPGDVHFKPEGSEFLAKQVAATIEKALP